MRDPHPARCCISSSMAEAVAECLFLGWLAGEGNAEGGVLFPPLGNGWWFIAGHGFKRW